MINPKELFGSDFSEFVENDPYNPDNTVEGYISRKSNEYYGALLITKINGREVPKQLIMATPKMHYPFSSREDGTRDYHFPTANSIEIYEKLDGTNILYYDYTDGEYTYRTCKTRLRPFVGSSRFGDFKTMWDEVSAPYLDEIKGEMDRSNCNLSFELYGARNPHLVMYKIPLALALLFGVTNTGRILSPTDLKSPDLPTVNLLKTVDRDYVLNYESLRQELNAGLTQIEDGYYTGIEGTVWYLHSPDGRTIQLKCKPEIIEAIHFSAGAGGLSRNVIVATCWNAFENTDTITVEFVKELLKEEFETLVIEANHYLIERCVQYVSEQAQFREAVLNEYTKVGMNILTNKSEVMRALSEKFPRNMMSRVYTIISNYG